MNMIKKDKGWNHMTGELGRGIRDAVALAPWQTPNNGGFFHGLFMVKSGKAPYKYGKSHYTWSF